MTSDTAPARSADQHGGRPQHELRLAAVTPQPPDARIETKLAESELPIRGHLAPARDFPELPQDLHPASGETWRTRSTYAQSDGVGAAQFLRCHCAQFPTSQPPLEETEI